MVAPSDTPPGEAHDADRGRPVQVTGFIVLLLLVLGVIALIGWLVL
jgi:hypothetical protein